MKYDIFFAFTPLHIKIINSIPKKKKSILVILNQKNLEKFHESYIDRNEFAEIFIYQAHFFNPINLISINKRFKQIDRIFAGNFKFFNFRLIELFIQYKKLITFDDGIGGITETYFNKKKNIKEFIYSFFGIDIAKILAKHNLHYGIYKLKSKLFKHNVRSLELKKIKKTFNFSGNVLLTTDKSESGTMSIESEKKLFEKIINNFDIKYLIHHPMKKNNIDFKGVEIIDEPYLSDDIVSCSNFNHVYSLSASSILGITELGYYLEENITYLANKGAPVSKKLEQEININIFNFEDL